ncbi:MAG: HEAT repeat domain-containing protein [Terriglobales bacterium]
MDFRIPAAVQMAILALLFSSVAAPQGVSTTPTPPRSAAHAVGDEPSIAELEEKSWLILQAGLHSKRVAQRVEAVKAISLLQGNRQAVRFALRALRDNNPKVRAAGAATLGELNATATIPALKAMLSDKDAAVMLASAHALYLLKDPVAYEIYYAILMGDKKTSAGMIQSQVDRLKDPKQVAQMGLQEGIGFVPYAGMGYEAYRQLMKHDSSPVRAAAARVLALDADSISEDALIQVALADKNVMVREAALDALAQRSDPKCIERLAINLDENKYPVRYRTAATVIHLASADRRKQPAK